MKVIFLDIDGVLCTPRSHLAQGCYAPNGIMHGLDREAVGLLNIVTGHSGEVRFVLISTWRLPHHPLGRGLLEPVEAHLKQFGWVGQFHEDWRTVSINGTEAMRGQEVANWLAAHPTVSEYLIIDDGDNFTDEQKPRHVRTNYVDGLSWLNFKDAARILCPHLALP